jgi:hypothetical protein
VDVGGDGRPSPNGAGAAVLAADEETDNGGENDSESDADSDAELAAENEPDEPAQPDDSGDAVLLAEE